MQMAMMTSMISNKIKTTIPRMKQECWSQEKTTFLKMHYQKMSNAKLAQQLDRTEGAVKRHAQNIGLRKAAS